MLKFANPSAVPTCDDGVKNQDETDIDCGGENCSRCRANQTCTKHTDCTTGFCHAKICRGKVVDGRVEIVFN